MLLSRTLLWLSSELGQLSEKKLRVVVTDYEFASLEKEKKILEEVGAELIPSQCKSEDDLIKIAQDADGLLNLYFGPISEKVLESLEKCRVVSRYGIGVDTIDIEAATRHGIIVTNVPSYCVDEVSDHTMGLILACARKIVLLNRVVRDGVWDFKLSKPIFRIKGKTLGLVGFGKIGRAVAKKAKNFGFNILFYDSYISLDVAKEYPAKPVGMETLLRESDFVSLHLPLNEKTRHFLDEKKFKLMKKTAFLINVARGGVVDTNSLCKALRKGWIAGAALDLVEGALPLERDNPLLELDNIIITPHAAWYSEESIAELQETAAREVARVLKGEWPLSVVNPEVRKILKRNGSNFK